MILNWVNDIFYALNWDDDLTSWHDWLMRRYKAATLIKIHVI